MKEKKLLISNIVFIVFWLLSMITYFVIKPEPYSTAWLVILALDILFFITSMVIFFFTAFYGMQGRKKEESK